jgi:Lon-like protease
VRASGWDCRDSSTADVPGLRVTRQTWTAFVSAAVFVMFAILLVVVSVPFVNWSPGGARDTLGEIGDKPMIEISGIQTYPTTGQLDLTVVASTPADGRLSLPQALFAYWLPRRDTIPKELVYDPGKSADELQAEDADMMETAQDDAIVAALRAANQPVTEMPQVSSVTIGGPAHDRLLPGDLVVSVDGVPATDSDVIQRLVRRHRVGEHVLFAVLRDGSQTEVTVTTAESPSQSGVPIVGINLGEGYKYEPAISFELGQQIGGPSAGLVFAVAIYDKLTEGPLLEGKHVAGTGAITPNGDVGAIGAIQEKAAAAEREGATAFLVPAANCADLAGLETDMTLIRVETLFEAIGALRDLQTPERTALIPRCS